MKIKNKILSIVFIITIFVVMAIILFRPIKNCITDITNPEQTHSQFDALSAYPFSNSTKSTVDQSPLQRLYDRVMFLKNGITVYTTEAVYFRPQFAALTRQIDKMSGMNMTTSLNNGQSIGDIVLPYQGDSLGLVLTQTDPAENLNNVIAFGNQMKDEGRNFLYFLVPGKFSGNDGYTDYSGELYKKTVEILNDADLDLCDMYAEIEKNNKDIYSLFFKTDHHWLPSTGIWADKVLCEYLNNNFNYNIDTSVFEPEMYETSILEKHFLGSWGKKVTMAYTNPDDFPIVIPKYDTDLEVFIANFNETAQGCIQDTLFDYSALDNKKSYYDRDDYVFYGYGDRELITIHNNNIHDGSRILMVKTSFADCMYPYLASVVEDLDIIDLRHFKGSLQTFIDERDPDTIVVVYGLSNAGDDDGDRFDFR